jgi:hypothetical protein
MDEHESMQSSEDEKEDFIDSGIAFRLSSNSTNEPPAKG